MMCNVGFVFSKSTVVEEVNKIEKQYFVTDVVM
jgi:hypothetical protein